MVAAAALVLAACTGGGADGPAEGATVTDDVSGEQAASSDPADASDPTYGSDPVDGDGSDPADGSDPTTAPLAAPRSIAASALADGCTAGAGGSWDSVAHVEPADAPPASVLYDVPMPAGGPHLTVPHPVGIGLLAEPLDVRAVVHNLEHGSIAVFLDPARLDTATLQVAVDWQAQLFAAGFVEERARAAVLLSVVPDDGVDPAPVSYRAWGVAIDCAGWDVAQADAVVATAYGSRGAAPEGSFAPYPEDNGVLDGGPATLPPGSEG